MTQLAAPPPVEDLRGRSKALLGLALPIIGGMASQNVLNLVDTAMVGQLGSSALAGAGMGGMFNWLAASFFMGLGVGVQAITARRVGEERPRDAVQALHGALALALAVALPVSLVLSQFSDEAFALVSSDPEVQNQGAPYLRIRLLAMACVTMNFAYRGYWNGTGQTLVYMRTLVAAHTLNIFLNWVLIYGHLGAPAMGVEGAGLASSISVATGALVYTLIGLRLAGRDGFMRRFDGALDAIPGIVRLSVPAGFQNFFFSGGFVAFYSIAQAIGTRELAATNALINLALTSVLPAVGLGLAGATLVGQSLGRARPDHAMTWTWSTVYVGLGLLSVVGATLACFAETWLGLLMVDPVAIEMAVVPLVLLGCYQPIDSIGVALSQVLLGAGAVRTVMVISITFQWGLFLPVAWYLCVDQGGGLVTLWVTMGAWRSGFALAMWVAVRSGRWTRVRV